jgi:hypothetical protein
VAPLALEGVVAPLALEGVVAPLALALFQGILLAPSTTKQIPVQAAHHRLDMAI